MKNYFYQGRTREEKVANKKKKGGRKDDKKLDFSIYVPNVLAKDTPAIFTVHGYRPVMLSFEEAAQDKEWPFVFDDVLQNWHDEHNNVEHIKQFSSLHIHFKLFPFNYKVLETILTQMVNINFLTHEDKEEFLKEYKNSVDLEAKAFTQGATIGIFEGIFPAKLSEYLGGFLTGKEGAVLARVNKTVNKKAKEQASAKHNNLKKLNF